MLYSSGFIHRKTVFLWSVLLSSTIFVGELTQQSKPSSDRVSRVVKHQLVEQHINYPAETVTKDTVKAL